MRRRRMVRVGAVLAVVLGLAVGVATPVVAGALPEPGPHPVDWSNLLQVTLQGMLAAALPIVVAFGVAWLKAKTNEVLSNLDGQTRWLVEGAVSAAVLAAERSGIAGWTANEAKSNKQYALQFAAQYLARSSKRLDLHVLANVTEAEVWYQFRGPQVRILLRQAHPAGAGQDRPFESAATTIRAAVLPKRLGDCFGGRKHAPSQ
jgi:hypothetical protein